MIAESPPTLWYLTRGTAMVALLLLTLTMTLGILTWRRQSFFGLPYHVASDIHRNVALMALAVLAVHIISVVIDPFSKLDWIMVFVPFRNSYRPLYTGLGVLAMEGMVLLTVTSLLRSHISSDTWRMIHYLAYLCWPMALAHGIGTGTDTGMQWSTVVAAICIAMVALAGLIRAFGRPIASYRGGQRR